MQKLLSIHGLSKYFPGVRSLHQVSFDVKKGEVLSLMGENGAGKSTLIKILAGVQRPDQGHIEWNGRKVDIHSPKESQALGISIIFQELNLLENMSVAENIFIAREKKRFGLFLDRKKTFCAARKLLIEVGLDIDPARLVSELSLSQKQMVELAKALSLDAQLIVMDEPTSSLTEKEALVLFQIIDRLKSQGVSIIFVSHKLSEVQRISDRVHVLRDGEYIGSLEKHQIEEAKIIKMMVGRAMNDIFERSSVPCDDIAFEVKGLSTGFLKNISFKVYRGEILGLAGLVGAGRTEVMRALFGLDKKLEAQFFVKGKPVRIDSVHDAIALGFGFVTEDRKAEGLILGMSAKKNISLASLTRLARAGFIQNAAECQLADESIQRLSIKTPSRDQAVLFLSGGNQQKVVLAKWLAIHPELLIVDEPTRGVDVGAKKEIHAVLNALAKKGVAILMVSSELPEILGMSDRILVMNQGRIQGELQRPEASAEAIMKLALQSEPAL
ncbi:MAG: sugar ABC transporter ATP-binding protein [Proteobacteria bacterium]|nr:sugar ABC transporter ATP-binding protein [Pseudomonadota bacterium]